MWLQCFYQVFDNCIKWNLEDGYFFWGSDCCLSLSGSTNDIFLKKFSQAPALITKKSSTAKLQILFYPWWISLHNCALLFLQLLLFLVQRLLKA